MMLRIACLLFVLIASSAVCASQQMADPEFDTSVERPAYTKNFPRVLFDEAHNNFHTATGRYKPFADLIINDGYTVVRNRQPFTKDRFQTFKILVIANALGAEDMDEDGAEQPAFSEEECSAVADWVRGGGNLLLIADHAPFGGAAENLAGRFGVDMSKGFTFDVEHSQEGNPSFLVFSRENKLLLDHAITRGRQQSELINRVVSFSGQSLKGSEGSAVFLQLSDSAIDRPDRSPGDESPAAGRAQALALKFGKGKVVVLGEAAMLTAQVSGSTRFGMNVPDNDNRQLALNIMHWLSGLLK